MISRRPGVLRAIALALGLWSATTAGAAEPRVAKYTRYDAGEYQIISAAGSAQARRIMEDLVKFRVTLERVLGKRVAQSHMPTTILIANDSDWIRWLRPRENVGGYFQRARFSNNMALDGEASLERAVHVVFHEYTHYFLATQFSGEYPPWFNEGLAELMGYAVFTDGGRTILRIPMDRVYEARDTDWIPFERLIKVDHGDSEYQSHQLAPSFYAQSWLTVHYGMVENRDFGRKIVEYLGELNRLTPRDEAIQKTFGTDLTAIDTQLREYARLRKMGSGALELGEVPPVTLAEGKPMAEIDVMAVMADFLLNANRAPDRIRPLVESLERRDPNKARAAILAARLATSADDNAAYDAAVSRAEAALAPGDWEQRRNLATVLLNNGIGNPLSARSSEAADRDVARSLKWFAEAVTLKGDDVQSLWGFGTAAARLEKHPDLAEMALVSAYKRAPTNADIALSLANLKSRQQKPEESIPYLKDVMRYSTDLGLRRWAIDSLAGLEEWMVERDKVEAENRRQREEYEKKLAEHEKKYGKKKK